MLNKMIKRTSALFLSLALLMPVQMLVTSAQETEPDDKIGDFLLEVMESNESYLDVTVYITEPDYSNLYQQVNDAFPEYPSWDGVSEDPVPERRELFEKLKSERGGEHFNSFLSEVGLSEDRVVSTTPLIVLATNEEIYDIAANDKVTNISVTYYPDLDYAYTAGDALKILRAAVGASAEDTKQHMGIWSYKPYDIDQDGDITTSDALIALRYSVRQIKECIGPSYIVDQRKARLIEKDELTNV